MSWKEKINNPSPTTTLLFGGETLNAIIDYFGAVDLTLAGSQLQNNADIATETVFATNTLKLWDSNKSNKIQFQTPDYTETKTWTFPSEAAIGPTDELMFKDAVQVITNKVINFNENTLSNLPNNSGIAASGTLVANGNATVYNIPHGLNQTPDFASVLPASDNARATYKVDINATNIVVTYASATTAGTNNISLRWFAGYVFNTVGSGGLPAGGPISKSGTGSATAFTIAHGLSPTPETYFVFPTTADAMGDYTLDIDATNITITYAIAPPNGSSNLGYVWGAGYVRAAQGFTPTSATILTNKTIGDFLSFDLQGSAPGNQVDSSDTLLYTKALNGTNNGLFTKIKKNNTIVEVQIA